MTVINFGDGRYEGLSTDTKPTGVAAVNSTFLETDTRTTFTFDGTNWVLPEFTQNIYSAIIYKSGTNFICKTYNGTILASGIEAATALQTGIDYAAGKGALFIKDGDYTCNALGNASLTNRVLTIPSNIEIIGESRDRTRIINGTPMNAINFVINSDTTSGNSNIIFKNVTINNEVGEIKNNVGFTRASNMLWDNCYIKNGANGRFNFYLTGERNAVDPTIIDAYVDNSFINNCVFESSTSSDFDNFAGGLLRNCIVSNCLAINSGGSAGFAQRLPTDTIFVGCISHTSSSSGFNMEAGSNLVMSSCIAHDCSSDGFKCLFVELDGFPSNNTFIGCQSHHNNRGFQVEGRGHLVTACRGWNNNAPGIEAISADNCIIAGNVLYNNGQDTGLPSSFRTGIRVSFSARTGYTYSGNNLVFGNRCYDDQGTKTQLYGISESASPVDNNYIFNNHVVGNSIAELVVVGASTKVIGNIGYVTENNGSSTQSGNASTTTFNIAHGLAAAPSSVYVKEGSADARGEFHITKDATNIILNYAFAPPSGSSNLTWYWRAEV